MNKSSLYIGLMSGTSADGIDLALVDFSTDKPQLVATYYQAYNDQIHQQITALYKPDINEIDRAYSLDVELAKLFAQAIAQLLKQENLSASDIIAIGCHGQTIRHRPKLKAPFTLQIGCCQTLATLSGIDVVGDFRTKDMVLGGQGAPLVPAFHKILVANNKVDIIIVNIGGIANITYLPADNSRSIIGFDTGPGNALMDDWYQHHHNDEKYDFQGNWAAQGKVNTALLNALMADPFFALEPPKSTGREYFNMDWLLNKTASFSAPATDMQATLCALTAESIAADIKSLTDSGHVYICGGGLHNHSLQKLLNQKLNNFKVFDIKHLGVNGDSLEAMAFAWFAYAFDKKIISNIPAVTGASKEAVLGVKYFS